ncbi:MAG: PilZ domain-containing protein [Gammaproteobacteria bacterium]|nr:PilZ domain-containing protein [Gammaproteobacteria bacterium]
MHDISLGGVGLSCATTLKSGELYPATLSLDLNGIQLNVDTELKVIASHGKVIGCQFVGMERDRRDALRYLITSYLSGEIADLNGIFNVMQRESYVKQRKQKVTMTRTVLERLRAVTGTLLFLAAGLAVLSLLVYKLYLFFFRVEASHALVDAPAYVVSMPDNGYLRFLASEPGGQVRVGQPIASVSSQLMTNITTPADVQALTALSGDALQTVLGRTLVETVISSPCECVLFFPAQATDRYAYKAEPLVHLLPVGEAMTVSASVPFTRLKDLNDIARVKMTVFGQSEPVAGTVVSSRVDAENAALVLQIRPDRELALADYHKPVAVEIFKALPGGVSVAGFWER